tara:strand:- start:217 stop:381 length:165 start_codon:yes stop_codon:yes gene_type:complete
MIIPSLFIEVISEPDKVKVEYSVERQRQLEEKGKDKMKKLNQRLKKMKKNVKKK